MNNLHFKSLDPGSMIDQYSERKKKNGKKNIYCCYFVLTGGSHAILIMKICTVSVKKKKKGKKSCIVFCDGKMSYQLFSHRVTPLYLRAE